MEERYFPEQVEAEAQRSWEESGAFRSIEDPDKEKFYCLSMFPYPSGRLHMGHVRNYTIGDVITRYQRMRGRNVLQPMGWDAFGLPAENAAMQNNVPPARWTYENIAYMRQQMQRLGFAYDWERELATCRPEYYRWEQWLFTRLYRKGLAYRKLAEVNWDPVDQTVLANEQVIDGKGWRSGAPVERRAIPQWFLRITAYADELLEDLDRLDGWPEAVRTMQRNWIGRSEGADIDFELARGGAPLRVYTTRPDTLLGATYMAVAPGHPLAQACAEKNREVAAFVEECQRMDTTEAALETMEKQGIPLGEDAIHPVTGEGLPIWVANFVLMTYGTGAIMAVPGHDERDHAFAKAYGLPIVQVIAPADGSDVDIQESAFVEHGVLVNSGEFDGLDFEQAFDAIIAWLEQRGKGKRAVNYRLRDWGVSRQRYWGCPVPIVHCEACGEVPVPDEDLPVALPEDVEVGGGGSPLTKLASFVQTSCPECGGAASRDTDTFDTFVESSWYFARFCCADQNERMLDERAEYWLPVDQYIGGIEHAILHLLYARFFQKLMRDEGLSSVGEPFQNLLTQGMVLAETFYRRNDEGQIVYYAPSEVEIRQDEKGKIIEAKLAADGRAVELGGMQSMSKSKRNGVDPEALTDRYGADTVRLYMMFTSPPDQTLEWSDAAVEGMQRFLRRIWKLVVDHTKTGAPPELDTSALTPGQRELRRQIHETIAKVGDDIGRRYKFNTAIGAVMELVNALSSFDEDSPNAKAVAHEGLETVVLMLSPIVPHITHVLWHALGHEAAIIDAPWPEHDRDALERDTIDLVVQVNGKKRGEISVGIDADRGVIEKEALSNDNVARFVTDKSVKKVIVVPGKLVNIVV